MLEWIWGGVLVTLALVFIGAEYRLLDKKPDDPGLGFMVGIGLALIAAVCVQDSVLWPLIKWLDVRLQSAELILRMLTIAAALIIAGVAYLGALFGIAIGLSTLTRRRTVAAGKAPTP